jgi:hypothetical protein
VHLRLIGETNEDPFGDRPQRRSTPMDRIPASERTREKLRALMDGRSQVEEERSELVRLAARLIIEEALEGEARETLGRDYYARGAQPGAGYRNGYRRGRVPSAEGAIEYCAPQIADREEPFRSRIREVVRGRTEQLESLAVEMYARGLSTRDIEAVFAGADGRSLLSRTAVSEVTERLWAEYEAFASRDLAEFAVTYLFVDGIAERLHLGQPRELPGVLSGHAPTRLARRAPGGQRRGARCHPRDRGVPAALAAPALPGAQDAKPSKQGARGRLAGVQGARRGLLPGGLAGTGAATAQRHRDDVRKPAALGGGLSRRPVYR